MDLIEKLRAKEKRKEREIRKIECSLTQVKQKLQVLLKEASYKRKQKKQNYLAYSIPWYQWY